MTALFATFLLASLALSVGVAFSGPRARGRLKWVLFGTVLVSWLSLGVLLAQILARTADTVVTPGGARQPHLFGSAAHETALVLASHGGPALLVTILAALAVRANRRNGRQPGPG